METFYFYEDIECKKKLKFEKMNIIIPNYMDKLYGNPSSHYSFGQEAKEALEDARARGAKCLGCDPREITFTSGGSGYCAGNVYGTYVHGFFDRKEILTSTAAALLGKGNETADLLHLEDYAEFKEEQYNRLARILRQNLDVDYIYDIMGLVRK